MKRFLGTAIALALAAPMFAYAAEGYLVADISLQSGPDSEYPPITDLAAGTPVDVQGCIDGYSWCDVIVGDDRGWVPGTYLEEEYDNQPVFLVDYGPRIGIPLVTFSIGTYWDAHYHNRPFYSQRTTWVNRHFTPRQPPRPIAHAPPIPNHGGGRPGEVGHAPSQGHTPPARTTVNTPQPRTTTEHRAVVTTHDEHPKVDTTKTNTSRTETLKRTTTTEHANNTTPKPPVTHTPPKPKETPKAAPKEEKKPPERKDDDHGH
jgi:uncharacterized protein YraI